MGRLEHKTVKIRCSVAALHSDGRQRLPSRSGQLRNILLASSTTVLPGVIAHHRHLRLRRRRVGIGEVAPVMRHFDPMIGILRRQQRQAGAVELHAVEVLEVGIAIFLLAKPTK